MTLQELIAYYQALLLMEYQQPNAQGQVGLFIGEMLQNQIIAQVEDGFDPATAQGAQLDLLGTYRGAEREQFGIDLTRSYFNFASYGGADPLNGFARYGMINVVTWLFLSYAQASLPIYALTDFEMQQLIYFLAAVNSMSLGLGEIDTLLFSFFGPYVGLVDNLDMTMDYIDLTSDPTTLFKVFEFSKALPRPAGVLATYATEPSFASWFGYQRYGVAIDSNFVGFGLYSAPQSGLLLRYQ